MLDTRLLLKIDGFLKGWILNITPLKDQFDTIQNLQGSPIPQTSFLPWTFFAIFYSNTALILAIFRDSFI